MTMTYACIPISETAFYALLQSLENRKLLDRFTFISQKGFVVIRFDSIALIADELELPQFTDEMREQWIVKVKGDRYDT